MTVTSVRRRAQRRGQTASSTAGSTTGQPAPATSQAPDASMDLLNQIIRQPVDPDYAFAAARGENRSAGRWTLGVLALIIGALFAVAALQTTRTAPVLQSERSELISRVQTAEREQDELRGRVTTLTQEIATLRAAALGDDDTARFVESQINTLDPVVGNVAVSGPGVWSLHLSNERGDET